MKGPVSVRRSIVGLLLASTAIAALITRMAPAARAQTPPADPTGLVHALFDARNAGDADAAARLFDDNAIYIRPPYSGSCARQSPCAGRAAILDRFRAETANHQCATLTDVAVSGSVVIAHVEVRNDSTRARGVERNLDVDTIEISQGKILALYALPDLADAQTAASHAIGAGLQAPGTPIPNPETPCGPA